MNLSFIKLDINIMNDTKIKIIRKMPDGDKIIVLWVGILCLGMKSGNPGILEIGDGIPFNAEILADELDIPLNTVRLGLETFKKLKMIELLKNETIFIKNFEKHQNLDKIEHQHKLTKKRMIRYRNKQKRLLLSNGNVTRNKRVSNATDKDKDTDKDKEKIKTKTKINIDIPDSLKADDNFIIAWKEWLIFRSEIKNKLVPSTAEKQLKMLSEQSDPIAVINQSIEKGWKGLFPIKNNGKQLRGNEKAIADYYASLSEDEKK